jgi:cytochrome c-550 PedF
MKTTLRALARILALSALLGATLAHGHGDVTPQVVDTSALPPLGDDIQIPNPYRANAKAEHIGSSAYNQNCARCHGLEAVSGGIAPDLRKLDLDPDTDMYFIQSVKHGKIRNGVTYMPPFEAVLNQQAIWAIKAYLETRRASLEE